MVELYVWGEFSTLGKFHRTECILYYSSGRYSDQDGAISGALALSADWGSYNLHLWVHGQQCYGGTIYMGACLILIFCHVKD